MISEALAAMKLEEEKVEKLSEAEFDSAESEPINLDELEEILGYNFKNRTLLEEAFTHASFAPGNCDSYDRLEYVGDAVLNLLFSKEHYFLYPELSSGQLTRLRASNVDTEKLARVAIRHGLHRYLRHNKPLFEDQVSLILLFISNQNLIHIPYLNLIYYCKYRFEYRFFFFFKKKRKSGHKKPFFFSSLSFSGFYV